MLQRLGPHLRGLFVALHLIAITMMAIPAPVGGMSRSTWKDPTVQTEFQVWAQRFTDWGHPISTAELEDELWDFARSYIAIRNKALRPFRPYYTYTGSTQSWRMFVAPHRYPARLEIAVEEPDGWRTVYRARDPELGWMGRVLDHDRMRSTIFRFAWKPYRRQYEQFCDWLAPYAARDFPEAPRARVMFKKYRTLSPQEVRASESPDETVILVRTLDLGAHR
ncbi:MAG: hypothetical protein H6739_41275 [Alphaproteobacteria bacterium]|nr:hypothetical protein [Alphaproteobacteria bacterium]